jgi:hypothetical protein
VALLAAIFAPITRVCPQDPRSTGPDSAGFIHRYCEVKPIAGSWLETISGKRWTIRYSSGTQRDQFPYRREVSYPRTRAEPSPGICSALIRFGEKWHRSTRKPRADMCA